MQIYDEKCRVYTSVRDVMLVRSPVDVHLPDTFVREINLLPALQRAQWNASAWAKSQPKCFMQIRQESYEEKKCENVLIQHECFSFGKSHGIAVSPGWHARAHKHVVRDENIEVVARYVQLCFSATIDFPSFLNYRSIERFLLMMSSIKWKWENKKQFSPRDEINGFKWRRTLRNALNNCLQSFWRNKTLVYAVGDFPHLHHQTDLL